MPVYNVENYLIDCLDSLINQTLKEIEIILINDGSTDNSLKIINLYAQYDSRIKIIDQENKGPSSARNRGLDVSQGEFISFIDSDDWIDNDFIEKLYLSALNNNCDIATATIIRKRRFAQKYRMHYTNEKIFENLDEKLAICNVPNCCYPVNKIYRKNFIKNFKFTENAYFEDMLWLPEVLKQSNKLITVPNTNYYYRVNNNSIVKKIPSTKKQNDSYNAKKYILKFFEENNLYLNKKQKTITKKIKFFFNIPILKIKEYENVEISYLLGFLPISKKNIDNHFKFKKLKKMFFYRELDSHIYLNIFGIHFGFKKKKNFNYKETEEYGLNKEKRTPQLIISLTTFPARINVVHKAINTLLRQTLKPDKLILWLAESQFPKKENELPQNLLKLKDFGLEIKWCEDLRSYKKLVPSLREYPNDIIVTADDDLYYQEDWLESLYNEYLKNPKNIYTRRACGVIKIKDYFKILPHYSNNNYSARFSNQLMGGAGTLYPPNSLHKDVLNINKIMSLIPTYDDIYFWAMAVANNTKIGLVKNKDLNFYNIENSQENALCKINGESSNMNDKEAFSIIFKAYPEIIEKLSS